MLIDDDNKNVIKRYTHFILFTWCVCVLFMCMCLCEWESWVQPCAWGSQRRTPSLVSAFYLGWDKVACEFWHSPACLMSPNGNTAITDVDYCTRLSVGSWDLTATPHTCASSALSAKPSPQTHNYKNLFREGVSIEGCITLYHKLIQTLNSLT